MRWFSRPQPQPERCPPHRFDGGWSHSGEGAPAVLYCKWCGDVRWATPPDTEAPLEELIGIEARTEE